MSPGRGAASEYEFPGRNASLRKKEGAMTFTEDLMKEQRKTLTENGAYAQNTTGSFLLDLFAMGGAMRSRSESALRCLFNRAFAENSELALKLAFYLRDVRGGLGERRTGREFFRFLAETYPEEFRKNLIHVPEYGRWDDLLVFLNTPLEEDAIALIQNQLNQDLQCLQEGRPVSLLAKWMPGVNASSSAVRRNGRLLARKLGMTEKTYRKVLSSLRSYLNITEKNLSMDTIDCIRYSEVPSKAMNRYRNAFSKRDYSRFSQFLCDVESGKDDIHSGTLFPYDIVEKYLYGKTGYDRVLEEQWKALPDFTDDQDRFLVMADVSGSMYGHPLATSVGLALYFAERSEGPFHNHFMTFSARPELVKVTGDSLYERIHHAQNADWGCNTDFSAALELILRTAVSNDTPEEEMPTSLVIITDMEFDCCNSGSDTLFADHMRKRFACFGYTLPNIVFWNVAARHSTFHAGMEHKGVQLVSGHSTRVFASLSSGVFQTPYDFMIEVLTGERYAPITLSDQDPSRFRA